MSEPASFHMNKTRMKKRAEGTLTFRDIITRSPTREEIYQLLVQLALLSSQLDDVIDDLAEFED